MIEVKELTKSFGDKLFWGIFLNFSNGKINLIIGRSGSGKTVAINLC